jgi:hypothetical protein
MPLVLSLTLAAGVLLAYLSLMSGGTAGGQVPSRRSLNDRLEEFIRAPASDFPAAVLTTIGFVGPARVLGPIWRTFASSHRVLWPDPQCNAWPLRWRRFKRRQGSGPGSEGRDDGRDSAQRA